MSHNGHLSCNTLRQNLRHHMSPALDATLLLASPLRRSIQTALSVFGPEHHSNVTLRGDYGIEVRPTERLQPVAIGVGDIGSPLRMYEVEQPELNWGGLSVEWPSRDKELFRWNKWDVEERAISMRKRIHEEGDRHNIVIVVSHGDFLVALTGKKFAPADYRIFQFAEDAYEDAENGGKLVEWMDLTVSNGGLGRSPNGDFTIDDLDFPELEARDQAEMDAKFEQKAKYAKWRKESIHNVSEGLKMLNNCKEWYTKKNLKCLTINATKAQQLAIESLNDMDTLVDAFGSAYIILADEMGMGDRRAFRGELA